jgi:hypothetical protein
VGVMEKRSRSRRCFYTTATDGDDRRKSIIRVSSHFAVLRKMECEERRIKASFSLSKKGESRQNMVFLSPVFGNTRKKIL